MCKYRKKQITNVDSKIPIDVLELLRTLAYQCDDFNNGNHSGPFVGVDEALDFIEQVDILKQFDSSLI